MRILAFAAALAVCCLCSCAPFGGEAELEAVMPELPAHWTAAFPGLCFRLVFADPGGKEREVEIPGGGVAPRITCAKAGNTAVLAYPESPRSCGFLRPAGALYPLDLRPRDGEDALSFSWEAGCAAWILSRLCVLGFDTSLVNAARLRAELASRPDPWALDLEKIVEKLAAGNFTVYDIDSLPSREVRLRPGNGSWFLESPAATVTACADGDTLVLPGLGLGTHALFSCQGGRIRISVGAEETVVGPRE